MARNEEQGTRDKRHVRVPFLKALGLVIDRVVQLIVVYLNVYVLLDTQHVDMLGFRTGYRSNRRIIKECCDGCWALFPFNVLLFLMYSL